MIWGLTGSVLSYSRLVLVIRLVWRLILEGLDLVPGLRFHSVLSWYHQRGLCQDHNCERVTELIETMVSTQKTWRWNERDLCSFVLKVLVLSWSTSSWSWLQHWTGYKTASWTSNDWSIELEEDWEIEILGIILSTNLNQSPRSNMVTSAPKNQDGNGHKVKGNSSEHPEADGWHHSGFIIDLKHI